MCLLSFVYHLINGSIDQYITNDTAGVNDNLGLVRISLLQKIDRLAASLRYSTPQTCAGAHTHAGAGADHPGRNHPPPKRLYHNTLSSLPAHTLRGPGKICPNAKMRDCANAEMSKNLNEHGRGGGAITVIKAPWRTCSSEQPNLWASASLLRIDLNRFPAFAHT